MSHATDDEISTAAQRATDEIHKVCVCGGIAAIAMIVASHATAIAEGMRKEGMTTTDERMVKLIAARAMDIINGKPPPRLH